MTRGRGKSKVAARAEGEKPREDTVLLEFVCLEAHRALEKQLNALDSMRNRSIQLVVFSGAATAFLVGSTLSDNVDRGGLFYPVAIMATIMSVLALLFLVFLLTAITFSPDDSMDGRQVSSLRGRRPRLAGWNYLISPECYLDEWLGPGKPTREPDVFYRALARDMQKRIDNNDRHLFWIHRWYICFIVTTVGQLVAWTSAAWLFG